MTRTLALLVLASLGADALQGQDEGAVICLAPASTQMAAGNNAEAVDAVRETFSTFLAGPTLAAVPLTSRLASQAAVEAQEAGCGYVLYTALKHRRKEGRGLLGRVAGDVAQAEAYRVLGSAGSGVMRSVASAAASTIGEANRNLAAGTKTRDELVLEYRLETSDGRQLVKKSGKRKAASDGEDLLTPLVETAAETMVAAIAAQR